MLGLFLRLLLFVFIIYIVIKVVRTVYGWYSLMKNATHANDECPACHYRIQLDERMVCPNCETKLVRNEDGQLRIRVN